MSTVGVFSTVGGTIFCYLSTPTVLMISLNSLQALTSTTSTQIESG